jgi:hypothetical protein
MRTRSKLAVLAALVTGAGALVGLVSPATTAVAGTGTPTFATYVAPGNLPNRDFAGEPSIGVNHNTGAVMYQANSSTYKVMFNDSTVPAAATWTSVTPTGSIVNIDPILATDSLTGRTWAGGLAGECSTLWYSDTDGAPWSNSVNPCVGAFDHETIGSGPWHSPAPAATLYGRAVYYCAQTSEDMCTTSLDGGRTFLPPVPVLGACGAQHGHVKVSHDGTAYLPSSNCGTHTGGGITTNNGTTWSSYSINQSANGDRGFDPSVATTPNDTVYEAWAPSGNYHPMVARSTTHGATWDNVTDLANTVSPPIVASTFQATVAGDDDRVAVAFLGTTTGSGIPFDNGYHGVWNLYVSYSYDGGVNWTTVKASPDPVQRGCIWDLGGSNVCRNLLDFMDANLTSDGRVVVGYADGCISTCAGTSGTEDQSTTQIATITRQSTGKSLYAAYDGAAATPGTPTLSASPGNASVGLTWTTPAAGGSGISGYQVWRGTTPGGETLLTTTGVVNAYTDNTVTNGTTYYYKVAAVNSGGAGSLSNEVAVTPAPANTPPTACFMHSEAALSTSVNGTCSSDPEGPVASYSWSWGDGSPASSGATASHTYAADGAYNVTLTVTDGNGATGTVSHSVGVSSTGDPDPGTPNLTNGVARSGTSGAQYSWTYYKVQVPAGTRLLTVDLSSVPACQARCAPNLDVAVRLGGKPLGPDTTCPQSPASGSNETCTVPAPSAGWYYVGVYVAAAGPATPYTVTATLR